MDWLLWLGCLFDYVGPSGGGRATFEGRNTSQYKCHSPVCNTVYNTTKQPLDGSKDMYEIEAESFTAARPKALIFDDLGMRLNNQLCFSRITCCMFKLGRALMGEKTCDIQNFHAPIRNRLQVFGCLVAVNHVTCLCVVMAAEWRRLFSSSVHKSIKYPNARVFFDALCK